MPTFRSISGRNAETYICGYLRRKNCSIFARNYRYAGGELDIVARNSGGTWLFVEVKSISKYGVGAPDNRVDAKKKNKIWQTAVHFLHHNGGTEQDSRFDVAAVDFRLGYPQIRYYKNAFISNQVIPHI